PLEPAFYPTAAALYNSLGRTLRGARILEKAWKKGLLDGAGLEQLGDLHLGILRPQDAVPAYRAALAAGTDTAGIRRDLGRALLLLHRNAEAQREFEAALQLDPADPYSLYYMGFLRLEEGDSAKAKDLLEKSLQVDGLNPKAQYAAAR